MQGRFAALSSEYEIYHVSNLTIMHYISLNSQRKMLYYNKEHIKRDTGLFKLKWPESEKLLFNFYLLNQDISSNINKLRSTKSWISMDEIHMQGTMSQIFDIGLSFEFIKCRNLCFKKSPKSFRFLVF